MTRWIPAYTPSDHEVDIRNLYTRVDSGIRSAFPADRTLIICFTNRSGSTFLAHALASTGSVNLAREFLNSPAVQRMATRLELESFDEYLRTISSNVGHSGVFALKAGLGQLYFLARLQFLGEVLPAPEFILIERDDVLGQAISWTIAMQTGRWTTQHEPSGKEAEYDFPAIDDRIDSILQENAGFKAFLARNGYRTHFVRYEELVRDPAATIRELATDIGLTSVEYRPGLIEIDPQANELKETWRRRYLEEVGTP